MEKFIHESNKIAHEQSIRIKELENQIIRNNQEIYNKNKKLEELSQLQNLRKYMPETPKKQ